MSRWHTQLSGPGAELAPAPQPCTRGRMRRAALECGVVAVCNRAPSVPTQAAASEASSAAENEACDAEPPTPERSSQRWSPYTLARLLVPAGRAGRHTRPKLPSFAEYDAVSSMLDLAPPASMLDLTLQRARASGT
jgi:hypothetical protein